jgi:hypothetical protein
MSDRHLTRIGRLINLCLLIAAVVMIGLAISGALKEARSPVPQLASTNDAGRAARSYFACCFYALRRKVLNSSAPHFEKAAVNQGPVSKQSLSKHMHFQTGIRSI